MTHGPAAPAITRRRALLGLGGLGGLGWLGWLGGLGTSAFAPHAAWALAQAPTDAPADATDAARFDAAVAQNPWLTPFKGIDDRDPARRDLACDRLVVTGRWPKDLRGRFLRNGPAIFERAGQRYHHWFDGDGMIQQFTLDGDRVSHLGRLVRTGKLAAEREAGRFLYSAFGTGIASDAPMQGPDSVNVANTSVIEHGGRVLAMWEGGSAWALEPRTLETRGAVTWQAGYEQVPFSAHPKLDPATGELWNIGTFGDRIVVWHIGADGRLKRVQVRPSPYPNGMAHDVAMTARHIVLPLPPVRMDYGAIVKGARPEQAFRFEREQPLRVLVMRKDDVTQGRIFELPARMVFHVSNAHETRDGQIVLGLVAAPDHETLVHGAVKLVAGEPSGGGHSRLQLLRLDPASGRVAADELTPDAEVEFPRVDPRRVAGEARHVVTAATWKPMPEARRGLFHGVQVVDTATGRVERCDYGADAVVEEHIVVPRPGERGERDAWLLGTTFDAKRQVTVLNVLDFANVAAGPIAQAALPYKLPLGFHGNFTAA